MPIRGHDKNRQIPRMAASAIFNYSMLAAVTATSYPAYQRILSPNGRRCTIDIWQAILKNSARRQKTHAVHPQEFGTVKLGATDRPFSPLASARISITGKRRRKVVPCPSTVSKSIEP